MSRGPVENPMVVVIQNVGVYRIYYRRSEQPRRTPRPRNKQLVEERCQTLQPFIQTEKIKSTKVPRRVSGAGATTATLCLSLEPPIEEREIPLLWMFWSGQLLQTDVSTCDSSKSCSRPPSGKIGTCNPEDAAEEHPQRGAACAKMKQNCYHLGGVIGLIPPRRGSSPSEWVEFGFPVMLSINSKQQYWGPAGPGHDIRPYLRGPKVAPNLLTFLAKSAWHLDERPPGCQFRLRSYFIMDSDTGRPGPISVGNATAMEPTFNQSDDAQTSLVTENTLQRAAGGSSNLTAIK
ncbi:hypothetical protein GGR50DRAFT_696525 [Xylaria sp. CBS 124048]|nr:hypothetical protein GGR50DRAFT_696525 [Xylaria sp. CBS 124048]